MPKDKRVRLPKLKSAPFTSKVSFELFDEEDNTIYRLKKADAKRAKHLIEEILGFKL